jgi:hypothetical protein
LCRRMRSKGFSIVHVDRPMTGHDLAITSFRQYWRRAVRSGYAYAEVANRYNNTSMPFWRHESRHNLVHGVLLIMFLLGTIFLVGTIRSFVPIALAGLVLTCLIVRTARRARWKSNDWATLLWYGVHSQLSHCPIFVGQMRFRWDRWIGRRATLIEYKDTTAAHADGIVSITDSEGVGRL